jgi:hypothetical protein
VTSGFGYPHPSILGKRILHTASTSPRERDVHLGRRRRQGDLRHLGQRLRQTPSPSTTAAESRRSTRISRRWR